MRQSFNTQIILNDEEIAYGFSIKADFCAEHSYGVHRLHSALGCGSQDVYGVERFMPSQSAINEGECFGIAEVRSWCRVNGRKRYSKSKVLFGPVQEVMPEDGYMPNDDKPAVSWFNGRNFAIAPKTPEAHDLARKIVEHAKECDVAVFMADGHVNPFSRGHLVVMITSLAPKAGLEMLKAGHVEHASGTAEPLP